MDELYLNPDKIKGSTYIIQLNKTEQTKIRNTLIKQGILGDDLVNAMHSRVSDLEDTIPIYKILKDLRDGRQR